ncbi:alpha,alpha-trehalose-phosphate synthase [UDP-forming] 1-like protein [Tanacetum coccineum]|uniref:Alpha,alpha-trehalose-phosphate synthase [UDP-forming] 1-like protein n=1 Tax=Tanacetum coccineum TaxID=301880 RepID=A0ABQ5FMF5_9ASTR
MTSRVCSISLTNQKLACQVHEIVGQINGKFETLRTVLIHHMDRSLDFHDLCALSRSEINKLSNTPLQQPSKHPLSASKHPVKALIQTPLYKEQRNPLVGVLGKGSGKMKENIFHDSYTLHGIPTAPIGEQLVKMVKSESESEKD